MVCPNRLFALDTSNPTDLREWASLSEPVKYVLEALGATPALAGGPLGAWREISVSETRGARTFNYRFDFILNPVEEVTPAQFAETWQVGDREATLLFEGNQNLFAPTRVDGFPLIVEVMTASTSGSSEQHGRGIAPAFLSAWESVFANGPRLQNAPGPNVRQVWGRMASQLIAKSEAGEYWGGRTVWLMQDLLLNYIEETTHISPSYEATEASLPLPLRGANIVSFKFGVEPPPGLSRAIELDRFICDDIPNIYNELGHATMHGILHAAFIPEPGIMARKLVSGSLGTPSKLEIIILP